MVLKIDKNEVVAYLFYGLLISSLIGYIGYYGYTLAYNINVYNSFSTTSIDSLPTFIIATIIRFFKDLIFVILFMYYLLAHNNNIRKKLILFSLFILYGTFVAFFSGYYTSILGGIRGYLYFFVLVIFFSEIKIYRLSLKVIQKIIFVGLIINFFVITEQAFRGTDGIIILAGTGAYRFMGLFGGWGPCSAFAAATSLFYYAYSMYFPISKIHIGIAITLSLLTEFMCGSRSGLICVMLVIYVWLFKMLPVKKIYKYVAIVTSLGFMIAGIIKVVELFADRGSILETQMESGRIMILYNVIGTLCQHPFTFLVGKGLGAGSNSSNLMGNIGSNFGVELILDGTLNTILYQWGMIGILALVFSLLVLWVKMKNVRFDMKLLFWIVICVEAFTSNLFENFACMILLFITYTLMCKRQCFN